MTRSFDELRLPPHRPVALVDARASFTPSWSGGKGKAEAALPGLRLELDRLQELFYADGRRGMLVVLQGMDASGKDGVIRHVFEGVNPQGVRVSAFRAPSAEETAHDFLWRIHRRTPSKGEIVIFNRSHYEDVLVARVHGVVPHRVWAARFGAINAFERELVDEGVALVKFFLHISRAEQGRRLRARAEDPTKRWKLTPADLHERKSWREYHTAYEAMLRRTTTRWAPWYVIPSDHKWFRNLAVSSILVSVLEGMKLRYPPPTIGLTSATLS